MFMIIFILYELQIISKMGNFCTGSTSTEADAMAFQLRNQYQSSKSNQETTAIILQRIAPGYRSSQQFKKIAEYIAEQPKLQFFDPNFKQMQTLLQNGQEPQSRSLKVLYNLQKQHLEKVYKSSPTDFDILDQQQVELCYASSIFYLICRAVDLKQQIFVTPYVNPHSAYIINLYCNGQPCSVVVDENFPTERKNFKYLSLYQPKQIWPVLLEKAWCKQIGGYDKSLGLSPEDCFEEITGIPAYSISFGAKYYATALLRDAILQALNKKYWIALTAKAFPIGLKARQVFYLQDFKQATQKFKLRSPYQHYQLPGQHKLGNSNRKGQILLQFSEILNYFEFLTIGTYEPGFVNLSQRFETKKNQEVIYQLKVARPGKANIRIVQFYNQYLNIVDKQIYRYSPILMELYNEDYNIIQRCEGVLENLEGARSSKLSNEPFVQLKPGTYYLRLQIDWQDDMYKKMASIVVYAPKNMLTIQKSNSDALELSFKLLSYSLQQPSIQRQTNQKQEVCIRYIQKIYGYIIGIENLSEEASNLKVIFAGSENIRINHHSMEGNELMIKLNGKQQRILEVLPKDPRKRYLLNSFDIVKV